MNFGYASMATYSFLGVGFWIVMVAGIGLALVYAVGSSRGRDAAKLWVNACMLLLATGGIADIVWAVVSGQWSSFVLKFGFAPIAEMLMLAAFFIGSMWFMAGRYIASLKK